MRATVVYTVLRLALFGATLIILAAINALLGGPMPAIVVLAIAALVSGVASVWLLAAQRRAMSASLGASARRVSAGWDAAARSEDGPESAEGQAGAEQHGVRQG